MSEKQRFDLHGQEAYAIGHEEGRRDGLIEAAKATCWMCEENHTLVLSKQTFQHAVAGELGLRECHAHYIHELIAADKPRP